MKHTHEPLGPKTFIMWSNLKWSTFTRDTACSSIGITTCASGKRWNDTENVNNEVNARTQDMRNVIH